MQALGLSAADVAEPEPELWPCCAPAVEVFSALRTQWRAAPMGGVIGLDYGAIAPVLRLLGVPRADWRDLFTDLRVLEDGAMQEINRTR